MKKILVAGATGYLGQYVVKEFKKQGFRVRALTRNPGKLKSLSHYVDEEYIGEVTQPKSLRGICKDIDIVFSSIGITKQKDNLTYMDVDYQGNRNILEEAKKEGVSRFIYVSVFNAQELNHLKPIQAKLRFTEELENSGLDYLVFHPNGFFSDMLEYLKMAHSGRGYVVGSGECKINPIHGEDLAEICVFAAAGDEKEIHVGGPDILTQNEIVNMAFEAIGKPVKISRIPIWIKKWFLRILKVFTSVKTYGPIEFFLTVISTDLVAPPYGKHHLKDFFLASKANVAHRKKAACETDLKRS